MTLSEFRNEPFTDFSQPQNAAAMERALAEVKTQLGQTYPLVINGERITTGRWLESLNPARPREIVGRVACADGTLVERAVGAAETAFAAWRTVPAAQRADTLFRAAATMRERKFELAAWLVYEVSKNWVEADADVAEAIDFCEFYGRQMLRLAGPQPVLSMAGERDEFRYIPLGPGAVIAPWNFPLAILCGMTMAAVVAGNTVVLKPAEQSPVIAAKFMEILESVGLPPGVVNFLPGTGEEVGEALTGQPRLHFIAFTGSKEVGLRIQQRAATLGPGQRWLKRAILEMGGKDCIVVAADADLDAAAQGIVASAFGFQGQKCSACSRVVAEAPVYQSLVDKVTALARQITPTDPAQPGAKMGAVIDADALDKIGRYLDIGQREGRLVLGGATPPKAASPNPDDGYFVPPTIFADVEPHAHLAQEEIFGPVLAFIQAPDFNTALDIANDTEYGLTGGVYARDPQLLAQARQEFQVGNLYFNRKITGAMVGVHPFGGFKLSGTDSKAGGPDYLLLFVQGQSIAEKV